MMMKGILPYGEESESRFPRVVELEVIPTSLTMALLLLRTRRLTRYKRTMCLSSLLENIEQIPA